MTEEAVYYKPIGKTVFTVEELQSRPTSSNLYQKGIFIIRCLANFDTYIGATSTTFKECWKDMRKKLNKPRNPKVSREINDLWLNYGAEQFEFEILEVTEFVENRKQFYLSLYQPSLNKFNPLPLEAKNYLYELFYVPEADSFTAFCEEISEVYCQDSNPLKALHKLEHLVTRIVADLQVDKRLVPIPQTSERGTKVSFSCHSCKCRRPKMELVDVTLDVGIKQGMPPGAKTQTIRCCRDRLECLNWVRI